MKCLLIWFQYTFPWLFMRVSYIMLIGQMSLLFYEVHVQGLCTQFSIKLFVFTLLCGRTLYVLDTKPHFLYENKWLILMWSYLLIFCSMQLSYFFIVMKIFYSMTFRKCYRFTLTILLPYRFRSIIQPNWFL